MNIIISISFILLQQVFQTCGQQQSWKEKNAPKIDDKMNDFIKRLFSSSCFSYFVSLVTLRFRACPLLVNFHEIISSFLQRQRQLYQKLYPLLALKRIIKNPNSIFMHVTYKFWTNCIRFMKWEPKMVFQAKNFYHTFSHFFYF